MGSLGRHSDCGGSSGMNQVGSGLHPELASAKGVPCSEMLLTPDLEYCMHFWAPLFKDMEKLKRVQRQVIKMTKGWKASHMRKGLKN